MYGYVVDHPRLLEWVIHPVNSSRITTFHFEHLRSYEVSSMLLLRISLPALTDLTIEIALYTSHQGFEFLRRHPNITTLHILDGTPPLHETSLSQDRPTNPLTKLITLIASPEHIAELL